MTVPLLEHRITPAMLGRNSESKAPALDSSDCIFSEFSQHNEIAFLELVGLVSEHAKSSEPEATRRNERNAGITSDPILSNQRILHCDGMGQRVFNDKRLSAQYCIRAKRHLDRSAAGCLEPPVKSMRGGKKLRFVEYDADKRNRQRQTGRSLSRNRVQDRVGFRGQESELDHLAQTVSISKLRNIRFVRRIIHLFFLYSWKLRAFI